MSIESFEKFHALGNDFVLLDRTDWRAEPSAGFAERICDRRRGIGADGVLIVAASGDGGTIPRMVVFNADGSRPEMCGNGLRCVAAAIAAGRDVDSTAVQVESPSGVHGCHVEREAACRWRVGAEMGQVQVGDEIVPASAAPALTPVDVGNPHAVGWVDPDRTDDLEALGRTLNQPGEPFEAGVNVEFVERTGSARLRASVFERGVGPTDACGTGACAVAAAAAARDEGAEREYTVEMPGGDLAISVEQGSLTASGRVERVFEGRLCRELEIE